MGRLDMTEQEEAEVMVVEEVEQAEGKRVGVGVGVMRGKVEKDDVLWVVEVLIGIVAVGAAVVKGKENE